MSRIRDFRRDLLFRAVSLSSNSFSSFSIKVLISSMSANSKGFYNESVTSAYSHLVISHNWYSIVLKECLYKFKGAFDGGIMQWTFSIVVAEIHILLRHDLIFLRSLEVDLTQHLFLFIIIVGVSIRLIALDLVECFQCFMSCNDKGILDCSLLYY